MAAIEVDHLTKRFGPVTAVDDLTFGVTEGSITGFVGPNGAGKTTTLGAILGLVRPDKGEARVDGVRYRTLANPMSSVGAVVDSTGFHPGRRARDHLEVLASAIPVGSERVDEALEAVGLADASHRRVGGFSLGMKRRLGLAGALLADPAILVLDEPANGLDPEGIRWLRDALRDRASRGGTVLISSHVIAELALAADHLVVIKEGRLLAQGTVADLTAKGETKVHIRTPQPEILVQSLADRGITAESNLDGDVIVTGMTAEEAGALIATSGIVVYEMRMERPRLEDVVLELTQDGERA